MSERCGFVCFLFQRGLCAETQYHGGECSGGPEPWSESLPFTQLLSCPV